MLEETLREELEKYLKNPSNERLQKLTNTIQRFHEKRPACPQCKNDDVFKLGTNPRKSGREQQYKCKRCGHIYTKSSIETKEKRTEYPKCPQCNSNVVRCGFWRWNDKKVQRYQCKKCGHYFRIEKKNDGFEVIEKIKEYSWEGRSLRSTGSSLSTKLTASGFQKKLMRYSKRFKRINIFEIFDVPAPAVVCLDEFQGSWLGKDAVYWLAKDPFTAVSVAWLLTTGHSFLEAISLESKVTQNIMSNPKIWIHDGRIDYHSGLISKYPEEIVRRVYLNRKFEGSVTKIVDENTYLIRKQDEHLLVEKGYSNPVEFMEIEDASRFTPTIKTVLDLFNNYNAQAVFILTQI